MQPDWTMVGWVGIGVAILVGGGFNLLDWLTTPKEESEGTARSGINAYVVLSEKPPKAEGAMVVGLIGPVVEGGEVEQEKAKEGMEAP